MECSWAELIKHLKSAENLDEVIDAHEEFLNSVIRRALLGEGSRDLLTQIRAIYDRIVEFDAVQSRYNPNFFLFLVIELAILAPNTKISCNWIIAKPLSGKKSLNLYWLWYMGLNLNFGKSVIHCINVVQEIIFKRSNGGLTYFS